MDAYLDHASTTPPHPAALTAMTSAAAMIWADPSRLYGGARSARIALDSARHDVASAIGARAEEIVFTSGGTESCNLAIRAAAAAAAAARRPKRIVISAIEHTAVMATAQSIEGFEVIYAPVDSEGRVDLVALREVCASGAGVVSVQHANQELGTLQPVADVAAIAKEHRAIMHTDACMTVGQIPVDVAALGVDLLSGSAHKAYGPKGAGLLWVRRGTRVRPSMLGDDRERSRRAGIENLPAIAGMAAALTARIEEITVEAPRLLEWTARLRTELPSVVSGMQILGHPTLRVPGLVAFSVDGVDGEALLLRLDQAGIAVHSGSSCVASPQEPSHVLAAIGAPTHGSIRVSLGRSTTEEHVDAFLTAFPPIVEDARRVTGS